MSKISKKHPKISKKHPKISLIIITLLSKMWIFLILIIKFKKANDFQAKVFLKKINSKVLHLLERKKILLIHIIKIRSKIILKNKVKISFLMFSKVLLIWKSNKITLCRLKILILDFLLRKIITIIILKNSKNKKKIIVYFLIFRILKRIIMNFFKVK